MKLNISPRNYLAYLLIVFILFFFSDRGFANEIQILTREGIDVSEASIITSDHIHIIIPDFSLYSKATYQLHEGPEEPVGWENIISYDFHEDLYFYKTNLNQNIRIFLEDSSGQQVSKIITLRGGPVTAHVDDPILPVDLVAEMGNGLIVEADVDRTDVDPEYVVIALKKAGIKHVRMHIGRLNRRKNLQQDQNNTSNYYELLDRWVNQICRHGLYCHIGNKTNSVTETVLGILPGDPAFLNHFIPEMEAWWTHVAKHYRYAPHRLSYHLYLETGGIKELFGNQDPIAIERLNNHYQALCDSIRAVDKTRNIIFPPGGINDPERLKDLRFPSGASPYYLSDFHRGFAGGEWHPYEERYTHYLNAAKDWMNSSGIPLIMSAANITDRVNYPTILRVEEIYQLVRDINNGRYPVPITFLKLRDFYDHDTEKWYEDYNLRVRLEVVNGSGSINDEDPDGDLLPTQYEQNICGTDPDNPDSDRDNISDYAECLLEQLDPLNPADGDAPDDLSLNGDYDGDGISNAIELKYFISDAANLEIKQTLDITNPDDSETTEFDNDNTPNIWEAILGFNLNDDKTRYLGSTEHDSYADHDGDGISTINEIKNNSWPIVNFDNSGDRDRDYDLVGINDLMPYINDSAYIVGYEFTEPSLSAIANQAKQGGDNNGELTGNAIQVEGVMKFDGATFIEIPNSDFLNLYNRSVNFHFYAGNLQKNQLIYSEGNLKDGLSFGIAANKIIANVWSHEGDSLQIAFLDQEINFNSWYAATVVFNGNRKEFSLALYKDNRPVVRNKIPLPFSPITLADTSRVTLGGTKRSSILYNPEIDSAVSVSDIYYYGYLDDFHIYNRALSETEISLLSRNDLFPAKDTEVPELPVIIPGSGTIHVRGVSLTPFSLNLREGEDSLLTATLIPEDATDKTVYWNSSDKTVAIVDSTGRVTAASPGNSYITVTTNDGAYEDVCAVTVEAIAGTYIPKKIPELKIFPNPATDKINIITDTYIDKVEIYSVSGMKLLEGNDISTLKNGMYYIVINVKGNIFRRKFLKIE